MTALNSLVNLALLSGVVRRELAPCRQMIPEFDRQVELDGKGK